MAALNVQEVLPPTLDSTSDPPPIFDGTTRLYLNYECPFCQRVWVVRNYKGLQDKIKLVAVHLQDKPAWYKEKLYPENKESVDRTSGTQDQIFMFLKYVVFMVPALEHNGKVIGESLDLIKYIDSNFEGPALLPDDPTKQKFAEEMIAYLDTFTKNVLTSFKGDPVKEAGGEFDYLETSLQKFDDGPFFLGQFSQVDAAYVPFIERFQIFLQEVFNYDITSGRPKLAAYLEELNKMDAYKQTNAILNSSFSCTKPVSWPQAKSVAHIGNNLGRRVRL
ncbi:Glutathione S-transferase L1 [Sesamum angolense]|uniref:Glutathione S-transferase L1 n=1 Tax=Sesamum angolense TaxID=2727404 RepID=A0AAE1WNC8_9LAMI|nr:Glutathione S-transferase L1 [Sesamum angolense]